MFRNMPIHFGLRGIRTRIILATVISMILSAVFISFVTYQMYITRFESTMSQRIQETLEQLSLNVSSYLRELSEHSVSILWNTDVMLSLERADTVPASERYGQRRMIQESMNQNLVYPRGDVPAMFLVTGGTVFVGNSTAYGVDYAVDFGALDWYREALSTHEAVIFRDGEGEMKTYHKNYLFSVARELNSVSDHRLSLGVVKLDVTDQRIADLCGKIDVGERGGLYLFDDAGEALYSHSNVPAEEGASILQAYLEGNGEGERAMEYGGEAYIANIQRVDGAQWSIALFSSVAEMNRDSVQVRNSAFFMIFIFSAITSTVLLLMLNTFLKPLGHIISLMGRVEQGDMQVRYQGKKEDEIGYLGSVFNIMMDRITTSVQEKQQLMRRVYESKLLQNEAQMKTLSGQIRPHFIYNTLNMINILIRSGRTELAAGHVEKLSDLMQAATYLQNEATLGEELSFVEKYLDIQCARYADRLGYSIDVAADLDPERIVILGLILQPLVENSVIHGCEKKKGKTFIRVEAWREGGDLLLRVADDAGGMDPGTLEAVRKRLREAESADPAGSGGKSGLGLSNVAKRIHIKYGAPYGVKVESGEGAAVTLRVPCISKREGGAE